MARTNDGRDKTMAAPVDAETEQPVEKIVPRGDGAEHLLDLFAFF